MHGHTGLDAQQSTKAGRFWGSLLTGKAGVAVGGAQPLKTGSTLHHGSSHYTRFCLRWREWWYPHRYARFLWVALSAKRRWFSLYKQFKYSSSVQWVWCYSTRVPYKLKVLLGKYKTWTSWAIKVFCIVDRTNTFYSPAQTVSRDYSMTMGKHYEDYSVYSDFGVGLHCGVQYNMTPWLAPEWKVDLHHFSGASHTVWCL